MKFLCKKLLLNVFVGLTFCCMLFCLLLFIFQLTQAKSVNALSVTNENNTFSSSKKIIDINNETDFIFSMAGEDISNANAVFNIKNNLCFYSHKFKSIGLETKPFMATLNGNGFYIENINLENDNLSIFNNLKNATITNLRIINTNVLSSNKIEALFFKKAENCLMENIGIYNIDGLDLHNCNAIFGSSINNTFKNINVEVSLNSYLNLVSLINTDSSSSFENIAFYNKTNSETLFSVGLDNSKIFNCLYLNNNSKFLSKNNAFNLVSDFSMIENGAAFLNSNIINNGKIPYIAVVKPFLQAEKPDYYLKLFPNITTVKIDNIKDIKQSKDTLLKYVALNFNEYAPVILEYDLLLKQIELVNSNFDSLKSMYSSISNNILSYDYSPIKNTIMFLETTPNNLNSLQQTDFNKILKDISAYDILKTKYQTIVTQLSDYNLTVLNAKTLNSIYLSYINFQNSFNFILDDLVKVKAVETTIDNEAKKVITAISPDLSTYNISNLAILQDKFSKITELSKLELFNNKLDVILKDITQKITAIEKTIFQLQTANSLYLTIDSCTSIDVGKLTDLIARYKLLKADNLINYEEVLKINKNIDSLTKILDFNKTFSCAYAEISLVNNFSIETDPNFKVIDKAVALVRQFIAFNHFSLLFDRDVIVIENILNDLSVKLVTLNYIKNTTALDNSINNEDTQTSEEKNKLDSDTKTNNVDNLFLSNENGLSYFNIVSSLIFTIVILFFSFKMIKREK